MSVHFLGTCEKKTASQCQIPTFPAGETRFFSEDAHMYTHAGETPTLLSVLQNLARPTPLIEILGMNLKSQNSRLLEGGL